MCYTTKLLVGLFFCLFTCISVFPQASLVKDINSTVGSVQSSGDYSSFFFRCGNYLYFKVSDETGSELWRTDGTTAGTLRVSDLYKGFSDGVPTADFECLSGLLIYAGNNGESGTEIYRTNGQVGIVQRVKDIRPGVDSSNPHDFVTYGSKTYFFIPSTDPLRQELWETNGTDAGTQFITEIPTPNSTRILSTVSGSNYFFFTCITDDGNSSDIQLWRSDGTSAGTIMLKGGTFFISPPVLVGDQLYFSSYDANGYQLWKTDGTLAGTIMVKDVGFNDLYHLFAFNDKLIFSSGNGVWISDGTGPGTISLATGNVTAGVVYSNLFYGVGYDFSSGNNFLLRTNGLVGNTEKIVDLGGATGDVTMYGEIPVLGDQFILPLFTNEQGQEVGISNRLPAGTFQLKDIQSGVVGSEPRSWSVLNSKVIFLANDGVRGTELWVSNGTSGGTTLLKDCRTGTEDATSAGIANIEVLNDQLYFLASSSSLEYNTDLWKSDGTDAGTVPYFDFDASPLFIGRRNDELYYLSNYKLYKTSGLAGGTSVVKDLSSEVGGYSFINHERIVLGNKLIFYFNTFSGPADFGGEYWVTDGTSSGTKILKDIYAGSETSINNPDGAVLNTSYIFSADNGSAGEELWITNGTEAGTLLLKDIRSGANSSAPSLFAKLNTKILFTANDGINGNELWQTDGTALGTSMLVNLSKNSSSSIITSIVAVDNTAYFVTYSDSLKWVLWKTNGTSNGTVPVRYFDADAYHAPANLTASNGKLFFTAYDLLRGNELWVSDGTENGTVVNDIVPGATGSNPSMFTTVDGITYFRANGELWKTNSTAQHIQKVASLDPLSITYHNGWIYFMASSSSSGAELYKIQHTKLSQTITFQSIPVKVLGDDPFLIEATSTSGLPVSLTTASTKISLTSSQVTLMSAGSVTINANQSGDISFAEAVEVSRTFCVNPPKPVLTISGSSMTPLLTSSNNDGNAWFLNGTLIAGATGKTLTAEETGTYTVQTTIDNCTSLVSEPQAVTVVGIEDSNNQIKIFPNPATETVRIEVSGFSSSGTVQVMDMTGRIVAQYEVAGEAKLDHRVYDYPPAIYVVKVIYEDKVRVKKFVKRQIP